MIRRFILVCSSLLVISQLHAQNPTRVVDSVLYGKKGLKKNPELTGANIGIFYHDSVYYYSYGYIDKQKSKRVDSNTVFEIGGVTKAFTGLLYADALMKGLLDENIVVERFIPVNNALSNRIKVISLGSGTSGLATLNEPSDITNVMGMDIEQAFKAVDQNYLVNVITGAKTLDEPIVYKNSNYAFSLLGLIVGIANNNTEYTSLLRERILEPLQLNHTTTTLPSNAVMAKGYNSTDSKPAPYIELNAMSPAGILKSTVTDLIYFLKYEIDPADTLPLASSINYSQQVRYTGTDVQSALGWEIKKYNSGALYYMYGKTYGSAAAIAFDRTNKLGIVIMLNTNNENTAIELAKGIYSDLTLKTENARKPLSAPKKAGRSNKTLKK